MSSLLSLVLGSVVAVDRVAIYDDETFQQIFDSVSPMRVSVREEAKLTKFQVEDGGERSDHAVRLATEITIDFLLTDNTKIEFQTLRDTFLAYRILTVQTKVASYPSMMIEALPHEEVPEIGSAILIPIRFVEWRPITPEMGENTVADPKQSNTVKRGQQQTSQAPPAVESRAVKNGKGSILGGLGIFKD